MRSEVRTMIVLYTLHAALMWLTHSQHTSCTSPAVLQPDEATGNKYQLPSSPDDASFTAPHNATLTAESVDPRISRR